LTEARNNAEQNAKNLPPKGPTSTFNGDSFTFTKRLEADLPVGTGYQLTCILLAERDMTEEASAAFLNIDSLDVEITASD
jgi:hypothetical protein